MKTTIGLLLFAGLFALAGCSHQADEHGFATTTFGDGATFGLKSDDALTGYDAICLKSITVTPAANQHTHDPAELAALEYAFESAFSDCVGDVLTLVSTPGPKTLLAEAKITGLKHMHSNSAAGRTPSSISDLVPVEGSTLIVGGLELKVTFYDPESGEMLAYFDDRDFGSGIESSGGRTTWARVHAAMNQWCGDMRAELEEAIR